ncbi:xanthine dehydrogenase family protein molybdopterin-binding subunit [Starkeya sp. ORNL1]|uniref:xanthine dehydrogenase family protein molybdopterin-binding subunit n=1 Tax=Starkeya sp. ORNL1 TaxID=2709380 RepID=UPI0014639CD1|nr:xanthine dehydrogenase family protein molybdopterin-binding subunit [Starkeya sp. ORNL1]QJP15805.1 xanthine dehydrogenase family protein molybdopterin-binding subunit [Starkeya sp. ORNL1]
MRAPFKRPQPNLSRRHFLLVTGVAGAGLTLGMPLFAAEQQGTPAAGQTPFEAYLRIAPDSSVTVLSAHVDMGQGIYTGIATLVAEELDADPAQMRAEGAAGNPKLYANLATGGEKQETQGSTATSSSFERYRLAGATARAMLVQAAAAEWKLPAAQITVKRGVVSHSSGKSASFGALAEAAAKLPVPTDIVLKNPKDWNYIGTETFRRLDSADKSTGRQTYTIDVKLPGMLTAVIAHPPQFGGTVRSFDARAAKAVKGVVEVVAISRGVAVLADNSWAAIKGREALTVDWALETAEKRGSEQLMAEYKRLAAEPPTAVAVTRGEPDAALAGAARVVEARYEFPYLAHAPMEPLDAVAWRRGDQLELWGGFQLTDHYHAVAARTAELPLENVKLHVMMTGGGFGRRGTPDAQIAVEAVECAKAIGWRAPVKVLWTREDDITGGRYRPMALHVVKAGLDAAGKLVGWKHRIVTQSILGGTLFDAYVKDGVDWSSVEGVVDTPYAVPNFALDLTTTKVGVPLLWWRSVGHSHTAYVMETMVDELAALAGRDPIVFRQELLAGNPRHLRVLKLAAEQAGWGRPLPEGRFRGVAVHEFYGTVAAEVAEIAIDRKGGFRVERVVCAVDCGVAVNPDQVRAQMEGSIGFGLGAILHSQITLSDGKVDQTNFDSYEVLRISEMPKIEVHIVPSGEKPTGVGEPGLPPVGPAVANALAAATGRRVRILPMDRGTG